MQAVGRVAGLSRRACRQVFEERFDAARMARELPGGVPAAGARQSGERLERLADMPFVTDAVRGTYGLVADRPRALPRPTTVG